jgi:hypothetical protein
MNAFNSVINGPKNMQAEDIPTLKRLQEKVLKEEFRNKTQKTIHAFFCKKAVN